MHGRDMVHSESICGLGEGVEYCTMSLDKTITRLSLS